MLLEINNTQHKNQNDQDGFLGNTYLHLIDIGFGITLNSKL